MAVRSSQGGRNKEVITNTNIKKEQNCQTTSGSKKKMEQISKTKSVPYKAGARFCDTCLSEKTHIALAPLHKILNSREEIFSKCPHKRDFKL